MTTTTLPSTAHAALPGHLRALAALITDEDLPPARITFTDGYSTVGPLLEDRDAETTVRRWAQALDLVVTERPHDGPDGTAERFLFASGATRIGLVSVAAILPVPAMTA